MCIRPARDSDHDALLDIWLRSVRATHRSLTEENIQTLSPLVRDVALKQLELWVLCENEADDHLVGFIGLSGANLEALFIAPEFFRRGGGRQLVEYARKLKGPLTVDVNEQNPDAQRFYEACGFKVVSRSATDSMGLPFPLLHLSESGA